MCGSAGSRLARMPHQHPQVRQRQERGSSGAGEDACTTGNDCTELSCGCYGHQWRVTIDGTTVPRCVGPGAPGRATMRATRKAQHESSRLPHNCLFRQPPNLQSSRLIVLRTGRATDARTRASIVPVTPAPHHRDESRTHRHPEIRTKSNIHRSANSQHSSTERVHSSPSHHRSPSSSPS